MSESSTVTSGPTVAICIITFRRPEWLARLLASLTELTFTGEAPAIRVVVVDNDPDAIAEVACRVSASRLRWPIEYHQEPRRGISYARNTALAAAGDVEFVAFIDDDEYAAPQWLDELLRTQRTYQTDVVAGPVLPVFDEPPPAWIVRGGFFDRRQYETGEARDGAFTGNVLIAAKVIKTVQPAFNPRYGLIGGGDAEFFRRVHRRGFKITWSQEAVVYERQPPSRVQWRWLVRRFYRVGLSMTTIAVDMRPGLRTIATQLAKGATWLIIGAASSVVTLWRGRAGLVRSMQYTAYGWGLLVALVGLSYREYERPHGK